MTAESTRPKAKLLPTNPSEPKIKIFMNAANRIKGLEIDNVSIEYLQTALQSILNELER